MAWNSSIIHDDAEYEAALVEYEAFFDNEPEPGTPEGDRFQLLGLVLAKYEEDGRETPQASPVEVIRFVMECSGRTQADLADLLGSRSRASEILSGARGLSLDHIRRLHHEWRIPAAALIGDREYA